MKKKITRLAVCALLFALCSSVQAQQPAKAPKLGFLTAVSVSSFAGRTEAFR